MSSNIPEDVAKHFGECRQTFRGMLPNIQGNVATHSAESPQTFWEMLSNIPENVLKRSAECHQTFREMLPMFGVNDQNYWAKWHLESCQTYTMELFYENSQRP